MTPAPDRSPSPKALAPRKPPRVRTAATSPDAGAQPRSGWAGAEEMSLFQNPRPGRSRSQSDSSRDRPDRPAVDLQGSPPGPATKAPRTSPAPQGPPRRRMPGRGSPAAKRLGGSGGHAAFIQDPPSPHPQSQSDSSWGWGEGPTASAQGSAAAVRPHPLRIFRADQLLSPIPDCSPIPLGDWGEASCRALSVGGNSRSTSRARQPACASGLPARATREAASE